MNNNDKIGLVARPEGVHNSFVDNELDRLTAPESPQDSPPAPRFVATPKASFACVKDYIDATEYALWNRPREALPNEVVYFIGGEDGPVKIGLTTNVWQRLENLQTGAPYKLLVLASTPGGPGLERGYHAVWDHYRLHGEWFERSKQILQEIKYLRARMKTRAVFS